MANLLVHVELDGPSPSTASRGSLAQARAVADAVGATVYALVYVNDVDDQFLDAVAAAVGRAGADRIWGVAGPAFGAPALDATCGPALLSVFERLRPRLVWLTGETGWQLGPPLAVRTGALLIGRAVVNTQDARVWLNSRAPDSGDVLVWDLHDVDRALIVLSPASPPPVDLGQPLGELELLGTPTNSTQAHAPARVLSSVPAAEPSLDGRALILVSGGDEATLATLRASAPAGTVVASLAETPPAALAASAPEALLCLALSPPPQGWSGAGVMVGPATRLAFVGRRGSDQGLTRPDVAWRPATADLVAGLATALAAVRRGET